MSLDVERLWRWRAELKAVHKGPEVEGLVASGRKTWDLDPYLSIYLSICLSVCLSIYLSICLSVCLSIYLSIYLLPLTYNFTMPPVSSCYPQHSRRKFLLQEVIKISTAWLLSLSFQLLYSLLPSASSQLQQTQAVPPNRTHPSSSRFPHMPF
jgi:hypothetical protein